MSQTSEVGRADPGDEEEQVATLVLRPGRRLGLGVHSYQGHHYWHLAHGALQRDGRWLELRRLSFPVATAEAFADAFAQLLAHIRRGSAP